MIRLEHIRCSFPSGQGERTLALDGIELIVPEAQFVTVIGTNGSGKSTLLNCIAGTVQPESGRVLFDGTDVTDLADHQRSRWVARIFQNPLAGTAPELSLLENFRLAALRTQPKGFRIGTDQAFRRKVEQAVEEIGLGLERKLDQPMGTFSGGQRQALTLVMAVMDRSSILLLDEPTAALDPRTASLVMRLADQLIRKHRLTALMVTHNLKDALHYGDRLLHLAEGRIAHDLTGKEQESLSTATLLDWFEA
ncbi:MAG: ABC transporter ATP-binding protein [Candidatus Pollutiaquabacter aromativorans]